MPTAVTHDTQREDEIEQCQMYLIHFFQDVHQYLLLKERFDALYFKFKPMVRKRIEFVLHDNYELYDDTEQDTWFKVWRHSTPEQKGGSAWLSTIATHTAIDALRKKYHVGNDGYGRKRRQRPLPASLDTNPAAYICIEAEINPIDQFLLHEEIRANLALISPEHRELCLLFADGMTYVEIMRRFNLSKRMVWRIIGQLHERSRKARAEALV